MRAWQHVCWAAVLDLTLGDPPCRFHPVRLMGRLAASLENPCRQLAGEERVAGVVAAVLTVSTSALAAAGIVQGARRLHPRAGDLASIVLLYTTLAGRDLADHAVAVEKALKRSDLPSARRAVARMVGRDTADLDTTQVVRATVESVAENTVDGVTSPLFYAFLGGAPAATAFKAISTLDSIFGYKDKRYARFGWASARLDDVANYVPARLTVPFVAAAAALLGYHGAEVVSTVRRDGARNPSPNSGLAEAAFAGGLGVRLGGPLSRGGVEIAAPYIGPSGEPPRPEHVRGAVMLMGLSSLLFGGSLVFVFSRRLVDDTVRPSRRGARGSPRRRSADQMPVAGTATPSFSS